MKKKQMMMALVSLIVLSAQAQVNFQRIPAPAPARRRSAPRTTQTHSVRAQFPVSVSYTHPLSSLILLGDGDVHVELLTGGVANDLILEARDERAAAQGLSLIHI